MDEEQKPGLPLFLQGLLDLGTGLLTRKADLELASQEVLIARANAQAAASKAAEAKAREQQLQATAAGSGLDQNTILLIGAALVGVLIVSRL